MDTGKATIGLPQHFLRHRPVTIHLLLVLPVRVRASVLFKPVFIIAALLILDQTLLLKKSTDFLYFLITLSRVIPIRAFDSPKVLLTSISMLMNYLENL